ncbi:MAG: hypothetical protein ABI885_08680 [Gammaproteobacteria bacterium]
MKKLLAGPAVLLVIGAAVGLLGCTPKSPTAPSTNAAAPAESRANPNTSAARPSSSQLIVPNNSASLRRYLQTTPETTAKRFDVEWSPDVVRIDRATAARTLLAVSADGSRYRFTSGDPGLAALAPGKIMALWGIAVRRVTAVADANGELQVVTAMASLSEIFTRANIEIEYALRPTAPVVVPYLPQAAPAPANAARASLPSASRSGFVLARYDAPNEPPGGSDSRGASASGQGAGGDDFVIPLGFDTWSVKNFHNFDITAKYGPKGEGIAFDLQARLVQSDVAADSAGSADPKDAPKLLEDGSSLWDLRIGANGTLHSTSTDDTLRLSSNIVIRDSSLALMRTNFDNVSGDLNLFFIARRGEASSQWIDKFKFELPVRFNIPVILGGLPFMFQVGFNFIAQPALTTRNDSFTGTYHIPFDGSGSMTLDQGKLTTSGTLKSIPQVVESLGSSIGVSAILIGIQAPRVGFGLGLFATSSVAYVDLVNTFTITSGGQLGMFHCKNHQLVATVNAGIDTQIAFPLDGWAKILNAPLSSTLDQISKAASVRQQVFKKEWYRTEPDIKACHID